MPVSEAHINRLRGFNFNVLGTDHCSDDVCEAIEAVCKEYLQQREASDTAEDLSEADQQQLRSIASRSRGLVIGPWSVAGPTQIDSTMVLPVVHAPSGLSVAYVPYEGLATQRDTAWFIASAAADVHALCDMIGRLRQALVAAKRNIAQRRESEHEAMQLLGAAVGCPRYSDSPDIFPQATENDGVCTVPHSLETLAKSAAERIRDTDNAIKYLERTASQRATLPSYLQSVLRADCQCHPSGYMLNTSGFCPKCGKAANRRQPVDQLALLSELASRHRENELLKAWKAEATKLIDQWEKVWEDAGKPGLVGDSKARVTAEAVTELKAAASETKLPLLVTIFTKIQQRLPTVVPWFTENTAGATLQLRAHADADVRLVLFHRNVDGKVRSQLRTSNASALPATLTAADAVSDDTIDTFVSHLKQGLPHTTKRKSEDTQYAVCYASTGEDKVAYLHVCTGAGQVHVELCNDIQQSTRCLSREAAEELLKAWKHIKWPRRTDGGVVPYYPH